MNGTDSLSAQPGAQPGPPPQPIPGTVRPLPIPGTIRPLNSSAPPQNTPTAPPPQTASTPTPSQQVHDFHGLLSAIDQAPSWTQWVPGVNMIHQATGELGEMAQTVEGGMNIGRKILGLAPKPAVAPNDVVGQLAEHKNANARQSEGGMMENMGEFFTGEELLGLLGKSGKLLSLADQFKQATTLAQVLEKYPLIAKLVNIGIGSAKQAAVAGGQTYLKTGGDAAAAGQTALLTGGASAAISWLSSAAGSAIRNRIPGHEVIEGQEFETPAPRDVPKPTKNQAAGQETLRTTAQKAGQRHLEELNESRREPSSPAALPARTGPFEFRLKPVPPTEGTAGRINPQPTREAPRAGNARPANPQPGQTEYARIGTEPEYIRPGDTVAQRTGRSHVERRTPALLGPEAGTGQSDVARGGGTLITQDPNVARAHVDRLNRAIEGPFQPGETPFNEQTADRQAQLLDARQDAQRQLAAYHEEVKTQLPGYDHPQLPEVDIPSAVQKIGSWRDTAATVKQPAIDGYNRIMDALAFTGESPQKLTMIRQAYQSAEAKFMAAETPEALKAAQNEIDATHGQLRQMLDRIPNAISLKEFSALNDSYRNALGLEKVSRAIDGAFQGQATSTAKRAYEYSGFNGQQLQTNMNKLISSMGRGAVERLMGRDNLDSVLRAAQLNMTNAQRAAWGVALNKVKEGLIRMHVGPIAAGGYLGHMVGLPWEVGAAGGWVTAEGTRRLSDLIITNPKLAKTFMYAVEYGAKPENYGPFMANMIRQLVQKSQGGG